MRIVDTKAQRVAAEIILLLMRSFARESNSKSLMANTHNKSNVCVTTFDTPAADDCRSVSFYTEREMKSQVCSAGLISRIFLFALCIRNQQL
jgi:hypothetical protein